MTSAETKIHKTPALSIIVAVAENGVIGHENRLLWRLKSDLRRFRAMTLGKAVIMGRKTYDSIGKPLPGRESIILTRDKKFHLEGAHIAHTLDQALALAKTITANNNGDEIMVAGGADIYLQTLPLADYVYLTKVACSPEGDAFFPDMDQRAFEEISRSNQPAGPDDEYSAVFIDYKRR